MYGLHSSTLVHINTAISCSVRRRAFNFLIGTRTPACKRCSLHGRSGTDVHGVILPVHSAMLDKNLHTFRSFSLRCNAPHSVASPSCIAGTQPGRPRSGGRPAHCAPARGPPSSHPSPTRPPGPPLPPAGGQAPGLDQGPAPGAPRRVSKKNGSLASPGRFARPGRACFRPEVAHFEMKGDVDLARIFFKFGDPGASGGFLYF